MLKRRSFGAELSAEFIGTFVILAFGIGSVVQALGYNHGQGIYTTANIPWGWGIGVALAIYVAGGISGAHLNPAVTFAFALRRGFPWRKVGPYWLAQTAGAFVAAALMFLNYHSTIAKLDPGKTFASQGIFSTAPNAAGGIGMWGGLVDEIIITAIFVLAIFALVDRRNQAPLSNVGPLLIGLLVAAIGFSFGQSSGWAINPARDLGPRLFTFIAGWHTAWKDGAGQVYFWVPIVGPLLGGAIGAYVYDGFIGRFLPFGEQEPGDQADEAGGEPVARDRAEASAVRNGSEALHA